MAALTADLEAQIEAYLLGRLSDAEQTRIEALLFEDEDVFEAVRNAEDDLIDRYLAGELARPDRDAFEQAFATSTTRQDRIAFARTLARGDSDAVAAGAAPLAVAESGRDRSARSSAARRFGIPAAAAALAAALVIAMVWRATRNDRSGAPSAETVVTFALRPIESRRGAGSLPRLVLPRGTTAIRIEPELEAPHPAARYAVTLRRVEGALAWQGTVQADVERGPFSVIVPAQRVEPGDYVLSLAAPGTPPEDRAEYPFRIVAPD